MCDATDATNNKVTKSFTVTVNNSPENNAPAGPSDTHDNDSQVHPNQVAMTSFEPLVDIYPLIVIVASVVVIGAGIA